MPNVRSKNRRQSHDFLFKNRKNDFAFIKSGKFEVIML
jgi:hypothetical protein